MENFLKKKITGGRGGYGRIKENKKYILMNNLGSKQSVNEIWPDYAILQKKKIL